MEGKRMSKPENTPDWFFSIVENSWCMNPKERYKIDQIIKLLELGYSSL